VKKKQGTYIHTQFGVVMGEMFDEREQLFKKDRMNVAIDRLARTRSHSFTAPVLPKFLFIESHLIGVALQQ
jgi:hypothetical protein